jgi:hypothetical protein
MRPSLAVGADPTGPRAVPAAPAGPTRPETAHDIHRLFTGESEYLRIVQAGPPGSPTPDRRRARRWRSSIWATRQLYLGDPAAAGEPPRQLKGFQKVTLRPGRSTVVSFTLDGHDLSYRSDPANGWVVPAGRFRMDVGDSSALSGLPLRGAFTVTG